jgi:hypothetical protein
VHLPSVHEYLPGARSPQVYGVIHDRVVLTPGSKMTDGNAELPSSLRACGLPSDVSPRSSEAARKAYAWWPAAMVVGRMAAKEDRAACRLPGAAVDMAPEQLMSWGPETPAWTWWSISTSFRPRRTAVAAVPGWSPESFRSGHGQTG